MKLSTEHCNADESGVLIVPEMKGQVETGQPAPDVPKTASVKIPVAININMSLPHPGTYGIVVTAGSSTTQLSFEAIFAGQKVEFEPEGSAPERGNWAIIARLLLRSPNGRYSRDTRVSTRPLTRHYSSEY